MNWDTISSGTTNDIYGFGPAGRVFAVGANGTLHMSTDAGDSLQAIPVPTSEDLRSLSSSGQNANWLVACGSNETIIKSTDGGDNWFLQSTPTTENLLSIVAPSNNIHLAVGTNGIIIKTTDGGGDPVAVEANEEIPDNYTLYQNYHNPFNPSTTISRQSPVGSHQTIKVYDLLGREVATLVDEYKPSGRYEVEFDASKLQSGTYFYKLQSGSFVQTKKMVFLK